MPWAHQNPNVTRLVTSSEVSSTIPTREEKIVVGFAVLFLFFLGLCATALRYIHTNVRIGFPFVFGDFFFCLFYTQ